MVSVNPMSSERELSHLLTDSGRVVLVCLEDLYDAVARDVVGAHRRPAGRHDQRARAPGPPTTRGCSPA